MYLPGDKVTRVTPYGASEIGIVKRSSSDTHTFVVYHCNDDCIHYDDYTAASTDNRELRPGWILR